MKSVERHWYLMIFVWLLLLVQFSLHHMIILNNILNYSFNIFIGLGVNFLMFLILCLITGLSVRCSNNFKHHKQAKYLIFRNIFFFKATLTVVLLCLALVNLIYTVLCNKYTHHTHIPMFCASLALPFLFEITLVLIICGEIVYVYVFTIIICLGQCCMENGFRGVFSCKNCAHEVILCDQEVFDNRFEGKSYNYNSRVINTEDERELLLV